MSLLSLCQRINDYEPGICGGIYEKIKPIYLVIRCTIVGTPFPHKYYRMDKIIIGHDTLGIKLGYQFLNKILYPPFDGDTHVTLKGKKESDKLVIYNNKMYAIGIKKNDMAGPGLEGYFITKPFYNYDVKMIPYEDISPDEYNNRKKGEYKLIVNDDMLDKFNNNKCDLDIDELFDEL